MFLIVMLFAEDGLLVDAAASSRIEYPSNKDAAYQTEQGVIALTLA
jgi:hypothetical protein